MKLRKYFNYPSKKEVLLIAEGCEMLRLMAKQKTDEWYINDSNTQIKSDMICPNCGDENIVNKITRVEGSGYVSGYFSYGNGSIYGNTKIDTNEVNHCNKCGNQWKKYKPVYKYIDDIIADWLNDLGVVCEGGYTYGDVTVTLLKDISAESIWSEVKRIEHKCYYSTVANLSLSFLRTKFKSVYD